MPSSVLDYLRMSLVYPLAPRKRSKSAPQGGILVFRDCLGSCVNLFLTALYYIFDPPNPPQALEECFVRGNFPDREILLAVF